MSVPFCIGDLTTGVAGEALCSEAWVSSDDWTVSDLEPTAIAGAFSAGFIVVGMCYLLGHAIRAILGTVRR